MPDESVGSVMKECFTSIMMQQQGGPGGFGGGEDGEEGPGGFDGPPPGGFQGDFEDGEFPEDMDEIPEGFMPQGGSVDTSPEVACTDPSHPGYNRPDCQLYRTYNQGGGSPGGLPGNQLPRNDLDKFLNGMVGLFFLN